MNNITKSIDEYSEQAVKYCAEGLHNHLTDLIISDLSSQHWKKQSLCAAYAKLVDAKTWIFNICTIVLITSVVFGIFGTLLPVDALCFAAISLFGRCVAGESYNIMLPNCVRYIIPNVLKPQPWLRICGVVILYCPCCA